MTIKVNGNSYELNSKEDLQTLREEHFEDWDSIRTANKQLVHWQVSLYFDELDRQDAKGSTAYYGKAKEVTSRVDHQLERGAKIYLHDIQCRHQSLDDERIGSTRIEHKTGFAQWAYGPSEAECWKKLMAMAEKGIVLDWDPFKDERTIVKPLAEVLDYLASYNPRKGLKVWFSYKPAKRQLQLQPVINSEKRRAWIEALLED